jgi:hypothetical protein
MGLSFTTAVGLCQRSYSRIRIPRDSWPYFIFPDSIVHQPGGPGTRIYTSRNRVAQLYPQTLGSLFVASYDSQGYGGGIRTRLRAGRTLTKLSLSPSLSHIATDGQSLCLSWCRAPSGAHDQILVTLWRYCFVLGGGGRPLWREGGSVFCQSLSVCTVIYILHDMTLI